MTHSSQATIIGFIGVALLLVAFPLNLFRFVRAKGVSYSLLNFVGAALAGYSSYLIAFMPFVILEGVWAAVAGVGLLRLALKEQEALDPH
jgi:hypothetical protein